MIKSTAMLVLFAALAAAEQHRIPDTPVIDQNGRPLSFYSDLVKGRAVAINFVFTSCVTVCPVLAANFRKVQQDLGENAQDVRLISISVDPVNDTPERLKQFAERFHAGPGWSLITGDKGDIDALLRALGIAVRNKVEHTPTVLVGNPDAGSWLRVDGLASASVILKTIREAQAQRTPAASPVEAQAAKYFPNLELITQDGVPVRFYDDVLRGKTALINFLFTTCAGVCPPMTANLARVQKLLGDRVGRDIVIVSISVDPEVDTPAVLKSYADKFGVKPGWFFLTGAKGNVDAVLAKLGGYVPEKNQHSNVLLIGNVPRGGWRKVIAIADAAAIANVALDIAR